MWSLGATLYHAVTGRPPYDVGDNLIGALYKIVHEDPPRLPDDHPMAGLLSVMMTRDPDQRWPMARVRDELARLARGQRSTVVAVPAAPRAPETDERTGVLPAVTPAPIPAPARASRRGALSWGLIAAVAVLAVAAIVAAYVWAGRGTPEALPEDATESSQTPARPRPALPRSSAEDTREQMDAFITSYIATVTTDPRAAFDQLTPEFQEASGGYDGYIGWWSKVRSAELASVEQRPVGPDGRLHHRLRDEDGQREHPARAAAAAAPRRPAT